MISVIANIGRLERVKPHEGRECQHAGHLGRESKAGQQELCQRSDTEHDHQRVR